MNSSGSNDNNNANNGNYVAPDFITMDILNAQVAKEGERNLFNKNERNSYPAPQGQTETTSKQEVCSIRAFLTSEDRCRRTVSYKNSVSRFHMYKYSRCYKLWRECMDDIYQGKLGFDFPVFEPRRRLVTTTPYRDRVPQASFIVNWWYSHVVPTLIPNNFACMKDRGVDRARETFAKFLEEVPYNSYCLKADLKDYFGNIPRERFIETVFKDIDDPWAKKFFASIIHTNKGEKGISLGSEVHQLSATAFPNALDKTISGRYERYMDDFTFVGTKEQCKQVLAKIVKWVKENELILSEKKTQIQKITKPIKFLGFTFLKHKDGHVTLKRTKAGMKKEKRRLRKMKRKGVPLERVKQHYKCIRAIMKKGVRSDLTQLDKYFNKLFGEIL